MIETPVNRPGQVLLASLVGTTIEFFDFYIYATAAVIIFPRLFFPASDPAAATLASLATFGIAFLARPVGSALFGHFGDRVGRKTTLVAALLTMGVSTVAIGVLPTYATIGFAAPLLLALCRFGQGLGLGGEWGGAVLLAIENRPGGPPTACFPAGARGSFLIGGVFASELSRKPHRTSSSPTAGNSVLRVPCWCGALKSGHDKRTRAVAKRSAKERVKVPRCWSFANPRRSSSHHGVRANSPLYVRRCSPGGGTGALGYSRERFVMQCSRAVLGRESGGAVRGKRARVH